jgi:hypothetical protein
MTLANCTLIARRPSAFKRVFLGEGIVIKVIFARANDPVDRPALVAAGIWRRYWQAA